MNTGEHDPKVTSISQTLSMGQAAKYAGVTKAAIRGAIKRRDITGTSQNAQGHYSIPLSQVLQYKQRFINTPTDTVDLEPTSQATKPGHLEETTVPYGVYMETLSVYKQQIIGNRLVVERLEAEVDDWKARADRQEARADRFLSDMRVKTADQRPVENQPDEPEEGRAVWPWLLTITILVAAGLWIYSRSPVT